MKFGPVRQKAGRQKVLKIGIFGSFQNPVFTGLKNGCFGRFSELFDSIFIFAKKMYKKISPLGGVSLPRPAVPLPEARGCVLSAWFTFIYRTTGLHAVGVCGKGLIRLTWVLPLGFCLPSPFVYSL